MRPATRWTSATVLACLAWMGLAATHAAPPTRVDLVIDPIRSEVRFRAEATGHSFTGRTRRIAGHALLSPGDLAGLPGATADVEAGSLSTGNGLRDRKMRSVLETDRYPRIQFRAARFVSEGSPEEGAPAIRGVLSGDLTVRGVTKPVSFEVTGAWEGATLRASGSGKIRFSDFGMKPPRVLGLLRVRDEIGLAFDAVAVPASRLHPGAAGIR